MADILARLAVTERASIDECYLDITHEARHRMAAAGGHPPVPVHLDQVHVSGQVAALHSTLGTPHKADALQVLTDEYAQVGAAEVAAWWNRPAEEWGPGERLLACGAAVVAELRAAVREELGYSCSAGGAHV